MRLVLCIHMESTGQQESPGSRSRHCLCTWLAIGLRWDPPLSLSQDPTEPADPCPSTLSLQTEPNDPVPPTCFFAASLSQHHCPPIHSAISPRTSPTVPSAPLCLFSHVITPALFLKCSCTTPTLLLMPEICKHLPIICVILQPSLSPIHLSCRLPSHATLYIP